MEFEFDFKSIESSDEWCERCIQRDHLKVMEKFVISHKTFQRRCIVELLADIRPSWVFDLWRVTCDVWRVTCDVWRVTCNVWRVTWTRTLSTSTSEDEPCVTLQIYNALYAMLQNTTRKRFAIPKLRVWSMRRCKCLAHLCCFPNVA